MSGDRPALAHSRILVAAIENIARRFVGLKLSSLTSNMGQTYRNLISGQFNRTSPERGILQLAHNCCLNAIWDLWGKVEGKPIWQLVAGMSPEEFVQCIDFRWV